MRPNKALQPTFCTMNKALAWLVVNVVGIGIFLVVASHSWIEPELADIPGAGGGAPLVWALTALPIFAVFVLFNIGAVLWSFLAKRGLGPLRRAAIASVPLWLVAFVVDGLHHGA